MLLGIGEASPSTVMISFEETQFVASMLATVKPVRASGGALVIPGALNENKAVSLKLTS